MSFYTSPTSDSPSHSTSESPAASSGALTPADTSTNNSSFLSSSMSNLWGGLVRRFSSDAPSHYSSSPAGAIHHSHTSPMPEYQRENGVDSVYNPRIHRTASPMRPPPLEPLVLSGFREETTPDARLLTPTIAEEIRIMVPARLAIVDGWNLVYSLDQDGASLATLYEKCRQYQGKRVGFVLVVKDCEGGIFGGYLSDFPHPTPKYFGNGECFLWRASLTASLPPPPSEDTSTLTSRSTTIAALTPPPRPDHPLSFRSSPQARSSVPPSPSIRFKAFPYSGVNEYYMLCEAHFFSMGAGDGKYGLWLDDGLEKGVSSTSLTFGNERLSDEGEKFSILGVEVWVVGAEAP